ncbi:Beta-adaptin-like protein A [Hibiscus syriacus]|uniref:Beta-adaptin-like protein A n=1 Tax=Hibiscus syriacus TaxID=106335 RepID=A0A6A3A299_HIBSY|nr:Beta-adaptin-like protein A [Hibiscus syriacus]
MTIGIDVSSLFGEMVMLRDFRDRFEENVLPLASTCVDADFPSMLKHSMLNDSDTQIVANCLCALQEIWSAEASTSEEASRERQTLISKPVIYYLLNRIKEFSEWAQCLVLELHANGAVVLATVKVFLQLTLSMTDVHQQEVLSIAFDPAVHASFVYERIKALLLTLVSSGSPEQSYAVLSHLHLLVMRAPYVFSSDYKHFYCQYNEPSYVTRLKLEMLTAVANESNTYEIVTELCEYAANVDTPIARESIRAVGKIALQQYDVNAIVDRLLQFLEMEKDYVPAEALVLVKDLRKYPQWSHDCIAVVGNISSKNVQEPKAKAALIWMLGEYSQDMQDAPYILESLVENWDEEHSAELDSKICVMNYFIYLVDGLCHCIGSCIGCSYFLETIIDLQLDCRMFMTERYSTIGFYADNVASSLRVEENDKDLLLTIAEKEETRGSRNNGAVYAVPYDCSASVFASETQIESAISDPPTACHSLQASFGIDDLLGLGMPAVPDVSSPQLKLNTKL